MVFRHPVREFLVEPHILLDLEGEDLESVARNLAGHLVESGVVRDPARSEDLVQALVEREEKSSAAIGMGVYVPHVYASFVDEPVVLFARLKKPLDLRAPDDEHCDLVFFLVGSPGQRDGHLDALTQIARLLRDPALPSQLRSADSPATLVAAAQAAKRRLAGTESEEPSANLARAGLEALSGRFAGGVVDDIRRRLPFYADDFRQGLNLKAVATTIFLFFACFTAAVTFGALMSAETGGAITTVDMLLATALCGVVYALAAGQPLIILGGTGPLLIFTALLYQLTARVEGLEFLPFYAWAGLWAAFFTILLAVTDASVCIRYVTRFTDEIFVLLIAAIFIVEAVSLIAKEFHDDELISYSTAISALVLAAGTFIVAWTLRGVRRSALLRSWARNFLADFGVVIAIASMSAVAYFMRDTTQLPHITVPKDVSLDLSEHLVPLSALPGWGIALAAIPGLFAAILIFLDQQITARVVNAPAFKLQKGPGYHLDLLLVGGLTALCSLLGWPWLVAATVRSLNHVAALSTTHAEDRPDGTQQVTDRVVENRMTGVAIHVLIGCSLLLVPVLSLVPMACLYGVFLYMGIATLSGNQFFERVTLWLHDPAMYPRTHYLRQVPAPVVHAFTAIQFVCLAVLWAVKVSAAAILFPLVLALMIPIRMALPRLFDPEHLEALDAEETPEEEADRELAL